MRSKVEIELETAARIATNLQQAVEEFDSLWPATKRGSRMQKAFIEIRAKAAVVFECIDDATTAYADESARITELEAENAKFRNRAEAEGFWLGKTTEKELKP